MIKLIALDLDGTLFDEKKNISDFNKNAIKMARDRGIRIIITTGRPTKGIERVLKELELTSKDDYAIAYNGGIIFNTNTNEVIHSSTISGRDVKDLYHESIRLNTHFHAFRANEELLAVNKNPYTYIEAYMNNIEDHLIDFEEISDDERFIKAMLVDEEDILTKALDNINPRFYRDFQMMRSSNIFSEFLNPLTNKGLSLEFLTSYLGLSMDEVLAIGDAGNDVSMINMAGIGVCMGNASDKIKAQCKLFTDTNENDGVGKAIIKYAL